jgi:hypothetical protein
MTFGNMLAAGRKALQDMNAQSSTKLAPAEKDAIQFTHLTLAALVHALDIAVMTIPSVKDIKHTVIAHEEDHDGTSNHGQ